MNIKYNEITSISKLVSFVRDNPNDKTKILQSLLQSILDKDLIGSNILQSSISGIKTLLDLIPEHKNEIFTYLFAAPEFQTRLVNEFSTFDINRLVALFPEYANSLAAYLFAAPEFQTRLINEFSTSDIDRLVALFPEYILLMIDINQHYELKDLRRWLKTDKEISAILISSNAERFDRLTKSDSDFIESLTILLSQTPDDSYFNPLLLDKVFTRMRKLSAKKTQPILNLLSTLKQKDSNGDTILHILCSQYRADYSTLPPFAHLVNQTNNLGQTPLMLLISCKEPMEHLGTIGVDFSAKDNRNKTLLMHAITNFCCIKSLELFPDEVIKASDDDSKTAMTYAIEKCDTHMIKLLANRGLEILERDITSVASNNGLHKILLQLQLNQKMKNDSLQFNSDIFPEAETQQIQEQRETLSSQTIQSYLHPMNFILMETVPEFANDIPEELRVFRASIHTILKVWQRQLALLPIEALQFMAYSLFNGKYPCQLNKEYLISDIILGKEIELLLQINPGNSPNLMRWITSERSCSDCSSKHGEEDTDIQKITRDAPHYKRSLNLNTFYSEAKHKEVSQAEIYIGNKEEISICLTWNISKCSVLIIKNNQTGEYLFSHIGTSGLYFHAQSFVTSIQTFLEKQPAIQDCQACIIYNGNHSDRHGEILRAVTRSGCVLKQLTTNCLEEKHLHVLYDANSNKVITQFTNYKPEVHLTNLVQETLVNEYDSVAKNHSH